METAEMKKRFLLCFMIGLSTASFALFAAPARPLPGLEGGMLKIQDAPASLETKEPEAKTPEIRDDRRNVQIEEGETPSSSLPGADPASRPSSWSAATPVPPRSLAAKLRDPGRAGKLHWAPLEQVGVLRGVRLPAVALSPDQSVLAIVETTGGEEPPNGSRIVLINTHTWEILKLIETPRHAERIVFAGKEPALYVLCRAQPELKQNAGLVRFLLDSGEESAFIRTGSLGCTALFCDREDRVYVSDANKPRVLVFTPDLSSHRTVKTASSGCALALSPDGRRWAAAGGSGKIEIFKVGDARPLNTEKIPADYPIRQLLFLDNGRNFLCAPDPLTDRSAFALRAGRIQEFGGTSAGELAVSTDGRVILHRKKVAGEIEFLDARTFQKLASATPGRIDPRTQGYPRAVFPLEAGELTAVLDETGNLYVLRRPEQQTKFQKKLILTPWK